MCSVSLLCVTLDPFIRLWAQDMDLLLFNADLPWYKTSMSETIRIEKLNGKSCQSWKYNIKLVLMERCLWDLPKKVKKIPQQKPDRPL